MCFVIVFRAEERLSSTRVAISTPVQYSRKRPYGDTPKILKTTRFCLPTPTQSPSFLKGSHMVNQNKQIRKLDYLYFMFMCYRMN